MARYKITEDGVFDTEKNHSIPDNENNRHWREYLEWLGEGNMPDPLTITPEEPVIDPRIAMVDDIQTINDVKDYLRFLIGV